MSSTACTAFRRPSKPVARDARKFGVDYRSVRMPMMTLAELCDRHVPRSIFSKSMWKAREADVLAGGDWRRHRPKVIVIEAIKPGSGEPAWGEWEPHLLAQGYRFALFDTLNRFYVANERPEIFARLPSRTRTVGQGPGHV